MNLNHLGARETTVLPCGGYEVVGFRIPTFLVGLGA